MEETFTCADCRFFNDDGPLSVDDPTRKGECRRNAPTVKHCSDEGRISDWWSGWPSVLSYHWCGELQPKRPGVDPFWANQAKRDAEREAP